MDYQVELPLPYVGKTYYLSFADARRPKGQQWLGGAFVETELEDVYPALCRIVELRQKSPAFEGKHLDEIVSQLTSTPDVITFGAAIQKTWRLGINPGGEVQSTLMPAKVVVGEQWMNRLLTRADLDQFDAEFKHD